MYADITQFILFEWYRDLWTALVLPNLGVLLPLLAVTEVAIGLGILTKQEVARAGLLAGGLFNLCIAPLGFWWPTNVVLAVAHGALARVAFPRSTARVVRERWFTDGPRSV